MKKLTLLLLTVLLTCTFAFATVFTVTSNADSGPGTLREAITLAAANGTASTDFIYFNIPDISVAGRTIFLSMALPDLTSNLEIDGTTQPGTKIGVSDAKIRISSPVTSITYVFRIMSSSNIGIYGLHFHNITPAPGNLGVTAIALRSVTNIAVGAAGKGNYFTNLLRGVGSAVVAIPGRGLVNGLSFKSNIVNLSEDGATIASGSYADAVGLSNVRNFELGGAAPNEGNYMSGVTSQMVSVQTDTQANLNVGYIRVLNNKMGCSYQGTSNLKCGYIYLGSSVNPGYADTADILVKGNSYNSASDVGSNQLQHFLKIQGKQGFIDIKANRIGLLNLSIFYVLSNIGGGIDIQQCGNGIIGGDNPADTNFIAGCINWGIGLGNNRNIKVTKNSIYCNNKGIQAFSSFVTIPKVKIFTITNNLVQGTTEPNCTVEVFLTKMCTGCNNGKTYLGNCTSDAAGNWSFTSSVLLDGAVTATATTVQGATGEFAKPEYGGTFYDIRQPTCNLPNGYIHGMQFVAGTRYYWVRSYVGGTDTIFTTNVDNALPGSYKFIVEQGPYCSVNYSVSLMDNSPKINAQNRTLTHPSCGLNNGSISNIYLLGSYNKVLWKNAANTFVGNMATLSNAGAGQYKLIILDTINGCGDSTAFYTLVNQSGPSLITGNVQIVPATCGNANGSISGITATNVTGAAFLQWVDSLNHVVGTSYNLQNVPAGKYRFKFKDASGCDTIITSFFVVPGEGSISVDTSNRLIVPSSCLGATGSITQLLVNGGDNYQWLNIATNTIVGNTLAIYNLPAGNYQLTITNNFGCTKTLPAVTLPQASFTPITVTAFDVQDATCGLNNGSIKINTFSSDSSLYTFRWVDSSSGQIAGTHTALYNLDAGTYQLLAKDSNGCEKMIFVSRIRRLPVPSFNYAQVQLQNDNCNAWKGSISALQVNGLQGGATYSWYMGNTIVGNAVNLQNVGAGTYTLKVTDVSGCAILSNPFTLTNNNQSLSAPLYNNLVIPRYTAATLAITNFEASNYNLYTSQTGAGLIQQNNSGNFTIANITSDTSFYIQKVKGSCTSRIVQVNIKVVDGSRFVVPTAFTPNKDGKNDRLPINVIGYVELHSFKIFNRFGSIVFETKLIGNGWDGNLQSIAQPTGTYVWLAEGKDINGKPIHDKGFTILIR